jgi:DNA-binding CsgD family transcriptional regulator
MARVSAGVLGLRAGNSQTMPHGSEALDRIARSGEAVFAIDSADRIILWNKKCEQLLGRPARSVLGKRCYDVIGGRDVHGNIYCYRNCPVAYQAREKPKEPVQRFQLSVEGNKARKWLEVSLFAIPSYHPALSTVVHVVREGKETSRLERHLETLVETREPLWPMTTREGEPVDLTGREKEVLRCLAEGLSTKAIAAKFFIAPVTVRNHVQSILHKLDVHTKLAAVAFAYQHELI